MEMIVDILRNTFLITGLVVTMMMMLECLNIGSHGKILARLGGNKALQVVVSALLGSIPGCIGGFASVSLYTHGLLSFGALVAMMIATSGDEAFVMLSMMPGKALLIFVLLFVIAVLAGWLTDMCIALARRRRNLPQPGVQALCGGHYDIHSEDENHHAEEAENHHHKHGKKRSFGWKRICLFVMETAFVLALGTGLLEHEHHHGEDIEGEEVECCECGHVHDAGCAHEHGAGFAHEHAAGCAHEHHYHEGEHSHGFNLLDEAWMNVLFAILSIAVIAVILLASDHFVEEHLWEHVVVKHLGSIFRWTLGVLILMQLLLSSLDISAWISGNVPMMIVLAALVGIIPESGPHLLFVTLYFTGVVPLPVLLASCISQDGHASIPLLAESKKAFLYAKLINVVLALAVGFVLYFLSL